MRSGVWLGALGLYLIVGCNTKYEAAPTACDDYCKITYGYECRDYDPAACVQRCEIAKSQAELDCSDARAAVVSCTQAHANAVELYCTQYDESPCGEDVNVLNYCNSGSPRDTAVCTLLCDKLVNTVCPNQDSQSCVPRCLAEGQAAPECQTERDAVRQCARDNYMSCLTPESTPDPSAPMAGPPYDPEVLPCKAERDALKSCGSASSGTSAAGAGGLP